MQMIISSVLALAAAVLTWASGIKLIPFLHKLKFGQTILDIGPNWHKKKQGTPTMGGIMFILAVTVCFAVGMVLFGVTGTADYLLLDRYELVRSAAGLIMALLLGFMGFLDDFIKVSKKHNEGLTVMQKTVFQVLIIAAYFATLYISGAAHTTIVFPWGWQWDMGLLYYPVMGVVIYYITNAVNLTDGVDGLCSSVTVVYMAAFAVISGMLGLFGQTLLAMVTAGACVGFLMWNFPPAKVFMGDTGSLFLGGLVVALGYAIKCPLLLLPIGIIYVTETMSDIIQIGYFKLTHGKRVFKMAPIHHHFEMCGWKEKKICVVFSLVNAVGCVIGALLLYFG